MQILLLLTYLRARLRVVLWAVSLFLCTAGTANAQLAASGSTLTATTPNLAATFTGADLVGLANRVTGESYLRFPTGGELATVTPMNGGRSLPLAAWTLGADPGTGQPRAVLTTSEGGRTLTLGVKIDAATGEIVLRLAASVSAPGLRGASWGLAGLDLSQGRLILPVDTGRVFSSAHPGVGSTYEYPCLLYTSRCV